MARYTTGQWSKRMQYDHKAISDEHWDEIKRKARREDGLGINELITVLLEAYREDRIEIKKEG